MISFGVLVVITLDDVGDVMTGGGVYEFCLTITVELGSTEDVGIAAIEIGGGV